MSAKYHCDRCGAEMNNTDPPKRKFGEFIVEILPTIDFEEKLKKDANFDKPDLCKECCIDIVINGKDFKNL